MFSYNKNQLNAIRSFWSGFLECQVIQETIRSNSKPFGGSVPVYNDLLRTKENGKYEGLFIGCY